MEETKKTRVKDNKRPNLSAEYLQTLTKEELIEMIMEHKEDINFRTKRPYPELPDFSKYEMMHVCFMLAYCGHNYQVNDIFIDFVRA